MKFIFLYLLIANAYSFEQINCDIVISNEAEKLAQTFLPVNCLDSKKIKKNKLTNAFIQEADRKAVCSDCRSKLVTSKIVDPEHKKDFTKGVFDELRKSLSQTMLELMTLRSSRELVFDPTGAANACNISKLITENDGSCFKDPLIQTEIKSIQQQLANEFSNIIQNNLPAKGLLERMNFPGCLISDKEVLFSQNRYLESFLPTIIESFRGINIADKSKSRIEQLNEKLMNTVPKIEIRSLLAHPLMANLLSSDSNLTQFLQKVKPGDSVEALRTQLYSKENAKAYAATLEKKCQTQFQSISKNLCNKEFQAGNFAIDSKAALEAAKQVEISLTPAEHAKKVEAMISYCHDMDYKDDKTILFSKIKTALNEGIAPSLQDLPLSKFKVDAYESSLSYSKESLCSIAQDKSKCIEGSQSCEMYKFYADTQQKGSQTSNILAAHDENVDKILRSLIGEPKDLKEETRVILVQEGILKNSVGEYNKKDAPERKTDYYKAESANVAKASVNGPQSPTTNAAATKKAPASSLNNTNLPPAFASNQALQPATVVRPMTGNQVEEKIRGDIESELMNRMMKQMVSPKQLEEMVSKAYSKGQSSKAPLTPTQVREKTREFLENTPSFTSTGTIAAGDVTLPKDKEKAKADAQLKFLKAKYGIDPANKAGSSRLAAGVAEKQTSGGKDLKVVAFNNSDELKIVVEDIKNLKGSNGELAKLVQNGTDFMLKVGNSLYKIAFGEDKKISILLPNGKKPETMALNTLESYFKDLTMTHTQQHTLKELRNGLTNGTRKN